jgi:hypothetical protein
MVDLSKKMTFAVAVSLLLSICLLGVSFAEGTEQAQGTVLEQSSFSMSEPVEETAVQVTPTPAADPASMPAPTAIPAAGDASNPLEQSSFSSESVEDSSVQADGSSYQSAASQPEVTPVPAAAAIAPVRSAQIQVDYPDNPQYGDTVVLTALLTGYDNTAVTVQWQYSHDGLTWFDAAGEGADATTYTFQVSSETASTYWRIAVTSQ